MVVSGLMLLQLPLVSVSSVANTTHKGLLPSVDPGVSHKPLTAEKSLSTSGALVWKVSGVAPGMSV